MEYISNTLIRLIPEDGENLSLAAQYRFGALAQLFSGELSGWQWFSGIGRGTESGYLTAPFYLLRAHGVVGVALVAAMLRAYHKASNEYGRALLLTVLTISVGSELLVNFGLLWYVSIALASANEQSGES
jgi:hypothetical protein